MDVNQWSIRNSTRYVDNHGETYRAHGKWLIIADGSYYLFDYIYIYIVEY